jgi:hypothetical protein
VTGDGAITVISGPYIKAKKDNARDNHVINRDDRANLCAGVETDFVFFFFGKSFRCDATRPSQPLRGVYERDNRRRN